MIGCIYMLVMVQSEDINFGVSIKSDLTNQVYEKKGFSKLL